MSALLALDSLSKAYPDVIANQDVSFTIMRGEIHALLGENGAGKSTLVKMIYGLVHPDSGTMYFAGARFAPENPRAARAQGIAMVFQHFSLFEAMTVAENIALGMERPPASNALEERIHLVSQHYGLPLDPLRVVGELSAGERQRVEIVRCLLRAPKLLIMDEPTSVLTPQEVEVLFTTLRQLVREGMSILFISHKLDEIRSLCHCATVLRRGRVVGSCLPSEKTARALAEMMIGEQLVLPKKVAARVSDDVLLSVSGLNLPATGAFGVALKDISFSLRAGEILGIAGVAGNGQDELLLALSGERLSCAESVVFAGEKIGQYGINRRRALGVGSAPEERLGHAAVADMVLSENAYLSAKTRQKLDRGGFIDWAASRRFAERVIVEFDVRTSGSESRAGSLSGGNLQKFVIGREICQDPRLLVVNQPTWGVDASAAAAIRQALLDLAARGSALVIISQDLDELLEVADYFSALYEGHLSSPRLLEGLGIEDIGLLMCAGEGEQHAAI